MTEIEESKARAKKSFNDVRGSSELPEKTTGRGGVC